MDIAMTRLHAFFFAFLVERPSLFRSKQKKCATHLASRIGAYLVSKTNFTLAESVGI
jgi:hypothetical protein